MCERASAGPVFALYLLAGQFRALRTSGGRRFAVATASQREGRRRQRIFTTYARALQPNYLSPPSTSRSFCRPNSGSMRSITFLSLLSQRPLLAGLNARAPRDGGGVEAVEALGGVNFQINTVKKQEFPRIFRFLGKHTRVGQRAERSRAGKAFSCAHKFQLIQAVSTAG